MMRNIIRGAALVALAGLGACDKQLTIDNPNAANTARALATPADVESFLGSYYRRWHTGIYGSQSNQGGMAAVMSFVSASVLAFASVIDLVSVPMV